MANTRGRLPELLEEIDANLLSYKKELDELPARFLGDPIGEVWRLLGNFKQDVNQLVNGRADDGKNGMIQGIRQARQDFREAIFQGAPRFKPYAKPSSAPPPLLKRSGKSKFSSRTPPAEPEILFEFHKTRQDTAERLEPVTNTNGTVVYLNEVIERAETSVSCPRITS